MMIERGLSVDHSTISRWVLRDPPELNKRVRREIHRAVDSAAETIDLYAIAQAGCRCRQALLAAGVVAAGQVRPRVINVDRHASYPAAIRELKESGELSRACQ